MTKIHSTAIVDPTAELGDDVQIGPFCIVERDVKIGPRCVLKENVIIRRFTTLGSDNTVDAFTVLGGVPQDLKFDPETASYLLIGNGNVFREGVTISRATGEGKSTIVGNNTYWMTGAHAGHNATVGDNVILVNRAAIAGHAIIGKGAILSAHVGVHQFCWVGEMCMSQGNAIVTQHVPPYCLCAGVTDIVGLNTVGLRRAPHITPEDRHQIKEAFCLLYRRGLTPRDALSKMDEYPDWGQAASKFREFVRKAICASRPHNRGLAKLRSRRSGGGGTENGSDTE